MRGYGILYRYGLFKQLFDNGFQTEHPDPWMEEGYPFVTRREERSCIVSYADLTVRAVPYDIAITGYGTKNVGTLRLWKAEPIEEFDYDAFNSQRFTDAIIDRERTMDISRVLYPNDTTFEGKVLRVRQQYFFCSASLQEIVENYVRHHGTDLNGFAEYNAVQLNDTHPVLAIPELMRILMDEHGLGWEEAWAVVSKTFAYTNHTVLAEALETWDIHIFNRLFPRIAEIVREIDRRFRIDMAERGLDQGTIDYMAPVSGNTVRMAWIACYASYSINGVAALHTEIIKRDTLKEWYAIWPERFNNKTNGVRTRAAGSSSATLAWPPSSTRSPVPTRGSATSPCSLTSPRLAPMMCSRAWARSSTPTRSTSPRGSRSARVSRSTPTRSSTFRSSVCTSTSVSCSTPSTSWTCTSA